MSRWYYRSIFNELEDMRRYMNSLMRQMYDTTPVALLPGEHDTQSKVLPALRSNFYVDVAEKGDEVIVTADMVPGVVKKDITLNLVTPQALEITCERKDERKDEWEGYYLRERSFGSMTRIIPLPKPVSENASTATFKNGVLEIHLKKQAKEVIGKIAIE